MLLQSCEYYLGMNQQPEFTNEYIVEGLNIFGLLRPDSIENYNRSFVFVQRIWPALEMDTFGIILNADVRIERIENDSIVETINFPLAPSDSFFSDTLYRPTERFVPQPRERYRLVCRYDDLPDAVGETIIPTPPSVVPNSMHINGRELTFSLVQDSLIKMYDIYLIVAGTGQYLSRILPADGQETEVGIDLPVNPEGTFLKIFGYDTHLASYCGNANTSLNINKYRTTISTLESGFGVFGSLNYISIDLSAIQP